MNPLEALQARLKEREKERIKSAGQTKYSRFDLEAALMSLYQVTEDLNLALDASEWKAALRLHEIRCDNAMDIFESCVHNGVIQ